jgi:glucosamine-6-phosphate deaminase
MRIVITNDAVELGKLAGKAAANKIRETITSRDQANILLATGASQFEVLDQLTREKDIDWSKVVMFHMDEYIGIDASSPVSFRKYLKERFLEKVSPLKASYLIQGDSEPQKECERIGSIIEKDPIDVALVGIGENGHLAFNDPPADFETEKPYIIVELDDQCRKQQYGEGWFKSVSDVPKFAISISIKQILKAKHIICSVPDSRKAKAVKDCLEQPVSNLFPASILQLHENCVCFLDKSSSTLLSSAITVK